MKALTWFAVLLCAFVLPCCSSSKEQPSTVTVDSSGAAGSLAAGSTSGKYTPSATKPSSGGTVHVKGYYRKDGTYVRPHTRRKPRS